MTGDPIRTIAVFGAGLVGHAASIAFRRALPHASVTLIDIPVAPTAMTDRIGAATHRLHHFHRQIGLDTKVFQRECLATSCLGTRLSGFGDDAAEWLLLEGEDAPFVDGVALHQLWLRQERSIAPWCRFSPHYSLIEQHQAGAPLDERFGVRFDPGRYAQLLARLAQHLGIDVMRAESWSAEIDDEGGIAALRFDGGRMVHADLYADCSGPDATLLGRVGGEFRSWSDYLPRLTMTEAAGTSAAGPIDHLALDRSGIVWETGRDHYHFALAIDDEGSEPGRRAASWVANVVAFGDAAITAVVPGGQMLSAACDDILRAIQLLPHRGGGAAARDEYVRRTQRVHDYVLDWSAALWLKPTVQDGVVPPDLRHLLDQFGSRGRVPFRDGDPLTAGDWIAMLIGLGIRPERIDPTALVLDDEQCRRLLDRIIDRTSAPSRAASA